MLPDYPKLKSDVQKFLMNYFNERVRAYGVIVPNIQKSRIFEGDGNAIRRSDGELDETKMMSTEAEISISYSDIPSMKYVDILTKLDHMAKEFAEKMEKNFIESLSGDLEKYNRVIDNKGKRLTGKSVLDAYRSMFINFDEFKRPELPTLVVSPEMKEDADKAYKEINTDPNLKDEFRKLMAEKREEWRAQQASRKLVG